MELLKVIRRQFQSVKLFNAYKFSQFLKEFIMFPVDYYLRRGRSYYPLNIALFLTLKCNAKCEMCNLTELLNTNPKDELTYEEITELVDEVARYKTSFILFGGEPFLRRDFLKIAKYIKEKKLTCGVFTNGTLLNRDIIKELIDIKFDYIVFSLQGSEKIHNKIVNLQYAYRRLTENIKYFTSIKKRDTKVIIHSTINEGNINDLENIIKLAEELKVDGLRFGHPTFFTREDYLKSDKFWKTFFKKEDVRFISFEYEPDDSNKYYNKIRYIMDKYKNKVFFTPGLNEKEVKKWYSSHFISKRKCLFIWRGSFIYPNGDVTPCESFYYRMGNIKKEPFMKIWNNKKYIKFRKTLKKGLMPACVRCCKL